MEKLAQNYVKFDIFGTLLFKKGVNPKFLVAALLCVDISCQLVTFPFMNKESMP